MHWTWGLAGSVLGAIFSGAQWFSLRRHVRRAVWWIPTHLAAWAGGAVIVGIMANPLFGQSGGEGIEWWKLVCCVLSGGAFVEVISGAALVMLIRRSRGIDSLS